MSSLPPYHLLVYEPYKGVELTFIMYSKRKLNLLNVFAIFCYLRFSIIISLGGGGGGVERGGGLKIPISMLVFYYQIRNVKSLFEN